MIIKLTYILFIMNRIGSGRPSVLYILSDTRIYMCLYTSHKGCWDGTVRPVALHACMYGMHYTYTDRCLPLASVPLRSVSFHPSAGE